MIKYLISDTIKYGLGKVVLKFFSILVVPLIAKNFSPDVFGEINIVTTFVGLFSGITVLGFDAAIGYYYYKGEQELKKEYLGTALLVRILFSLFIVGIFIIFAKTLAGSNFLLKNQQKYLLIILGAAVIPFDNVMGFFIDLTRFIIKPVLYNIANISKVTLYYALIVFFIFTGLTVERIFVALAVSSTIPAIILFFYYRKSLVIKINTYCLKKLLTYGLPLVPTTIMFWVMNSANRMVLNTFTSLESTGIFSLLTSVASIFLLLTGSILTAWPPYSMIISNRPDAPEIFAKVTLFLIVLLIPLAFFFWSATDMIILLFATPVYLQSEKIIILIVMQNILNLLYYCTAIGLTLKEKTIYITIGYTIAATISVIISIPLCKYYGIFGAALSTFIGYFISLIYITKKSQRYYFIPYNRKFIFFYSSIVFIFLVISLTLPNKNLLMNFVFRFSIGLVFLTIPFVFKIISISEIKKIFQR